MVAIKEVVVVLDHHFGVLQVARERRGTRLYGVAPGPGVEHALESVRRAGPSITLAIPEGLPREAVALLRRLIPAAKSIVTGTQAEPLVAAPGPVRLIVAADRSVRGRAVEAGGRASPHVTVAAFELTGQRPQFIKAVGPRESFERLRELIPYFVEQAEQGLLTVLGVIAMKARERATSLAIQIEELPLELAVEDPLLVRLDELHRTDKLVGCRILLREERRAFVAVGPDTMNDGVGVHGDHGHFLLLAPSPLLLQRAPPPDSGLQRARVAMNAWPRRKIVLNHVRIRPAIRWALSSCPATAAQYQSDVNRYSGAANLDASGPIASRHVVHPDNPRVVQALIADLTAMGYCAFTYAFTYAGQTRHNVIADLPGIGRLRIRPDILERIRELLITHPWPDPPDPWLTTFRKLGGDTWMTSLGIRTLAPLELRKAAFRLALLEHWQPWWLPRCRLAGIGAQLVIVGCHLDSTAALASGGYNPASDPAPGADDDASGIAATLAVARYMMQFRNTLPHTVRFCFFNAEEQGLVGSRAYAQYLKAAGAPVRAVVCADMIGYNADVNRIFEIHAGYTDSVVRDASLPIANTIASWASTLGALAPAQIYSGTSSGPGVDRTVYDGAIGRSDHASFHEQGYPAVVVSEDFFVNTPAEPLKDPNPNYHDADDLVVDAAYAADITCAIAYAVKELAGA